MTTIMNTTTNIIIKEQICHLIFRAINDIMEQWAKELKKQ